MEAYCEYLKRMMAIHKDAVRRLIDNDTASVLELSDLFEDVANLYLDISEEIRLQCLEAQQLTVPQSSTENRAAEIAD